MLEQEITRLNAQLQGGEGELSEYRRKITILEQEISSYTSQIKSLERENGEYRKRISALEQELSNYRIQIQASENAKETMRRKKKQKIQNLRQELARLKAQIDGGAAEAGEFRRKITRYEEMIDEYKNMDLKMKLLLQEIERLNEELSQQGEELRYANEQTEMYKRKFVEFSNMTEKVNNSLANYVVQGILLESLHKKVIELSGSGFREEKRASIIDQLKSLESAQRHSIQERRTVIESVEYV